MAVNLLADKPAQWIPSCNAGHSLKITLSPVPPSSIYLRRSPCVSKPSLKITILLGLHFIFLSPLPIPLLYDTIAYPPTPFLSPFFSANHDTLTLVTSTLWRSTSLVIRLLSAGLFSRKLVRGRRTGCCKLSWKSPVRLSESRIRPGYHRHPPQSPTSGQY